jgi:hypothetical protein
MKERIVELLAGSIGCQLSRAIVHTHIHLYTRTHNTHISYSTVMYKRMALFKRLQKFDSLLIHYKFENYKTYSLSVEYGIPCSYVRESIES